MLYARNPLTIIYYNNNTRLLLFSNPLPSIPKSDTIIIILGFRNPLIFKNFKKKH